MSNTISKLFDDYEQYKGICQREGIIPLSFESEWYQHYWRLKHA